ncbi:MAG TPA: L,D-transpeptidase family protein [Steroidobacteraceae bacterium]|jgi:murein L,D-transpeptidase YafK|nr:L,D-transpeptidase family protein [Steroidobacteraceae bacterium]
MRQNLALLLLPLMLSAGAVATAADTASSASPTGGAATTVSLSNAGFAPVVAPADLSAPLPVADEVVVHKAERRLYLLRRGEVIRSYRVALGLMPQGPKERAGDFRTPEGRYQLTRRNTHSDYFLSILVSYPNAEDARRAHSHHEDPGGSIMIHGLPNNLRHPPDYYATADWTDGCIALSNSDMVEVWLMTQDNVRVEILP